MDVKIGSRTWYLQASKDYIQRALKKDRKTTSLSLGFRISGLQIYDSKESGFWRPENKRVLGFTVDDTRVVLRKFVSSNSPTDSNSEPDENPNRSCLQDFEKNHSYSLSGNCVSVKTTSLFMFWHGPCNTPKHTLVVFDMFRVFCKPNWNVS